MIKLLAAITGGGGGDDSGDGGSGCDFWCEIGTLVVGGCKNSQMRELQVLRVRNTCGQVIGKHGNKLRSQLKALALLFKQHKYPQQNNNHVNINKDVKTMRGTHFCIDSRNKSQFFLRCRSGDGR